MRLDRLLEIFLMGISLTLFLCLSLYQIELPGLYYDEAADAVPAMQILLGQKVELVNNAGIWIGGHPFPIMVMDYVGAVNTYALLPLFSTLGINVFSLRLMPIIGGVLTLILAYFLARELFNKWVAATAMILLAVHPSFIFWTRQGIYITSIMSPLALGSLLSFQKWRNDGRSWALYLGFFLLGLGISAKILFLWFIVAVGILYFLLEWRREGPVKPVTTYPLLTPRRLMGSIIAFVLGAWMILLYNIETQGTLVVMRENLVSSQYGVNNLNFLGNMAKRLDNFKVLLDGGHFWFFGGVLTSNWYPPVFMAAAAVIALIMIFNRTARQQWRRVAVIFGLVALVLIQSTVTISSLWPTHLYILLPFAIIIIAMGIDLLYRYVSSSSAITLVGVLVVLALVGQSLYVDIKYHKLLEETGGRRTHSDAIYRLSSYLQARVDSRPVAMDWGIKNSVQILTQGKVSPLEVFQYTSEPNQTFYDWLYGTLMKGEHLYVFHSQDCTVYPRYEAFEAFARKFSREVHLEETIAEKDGTPIYEVYSVSLVKAGNA